VKADRYDSPIHPNSLELPLHFGFDSNCMQLRQSHRGELRWRLTTPRRLRRGARTSFASVRQHRQDSNCMRRRCIISREGKAQMMDIEFSNSSSVTVVSPKSTYEGHDIADPKRGVRPDSLAPGYLFQEYDGRKDQLFSL